MDIHRTESLPKMIVIGSHDLPARPERKLTPPAGLASGARQAVDELNPDGRLWRHQSLALAALLTGHNPVVATPTASGKTLIAQLHHLHQLEAAPYSATICCAPLRALSEDQFRSWRQFTTRAGQCPEHTVRIDGATPVAERADLLETAGVIVMTPDVIHSWLLPQQYLPAVRHLLSRVATLFVDEAHVYDSIFGASAAQLFRRLFRAISETRSAPPALIGATATIRDPAQHLQALTGQLFRAITDADNGAPSHPVRILHVAGQEEADLGLAVSSLLELHPNARFLAFVDRRQGAEAVAARLRHPAVAAYRSGYAATERQRIEAELRSGRLQGLIATPALEMGIHIPELDAGLNLLLPATRKSFRQRLGRIARAKPGLFILVAPPNALSCFGDSLAGYCQTDAEPCHIYLDNPFLKHSPNHSLRQIPGQNIRLLDTATGGIIGDITRMQAMREAPPDAIYRHQGRQYVAGPWPREMDEPVIRLTPTTGQAPGMADITTVYRVQGVIPGRMRPHQNGAAYAAEVTLKIASAARGYRQDRRYRAYQPSEMPRHQIATTGLLLRIPEPWCHRTPQRTSLVQALTAQFCHRQSVKTEDIGYATEAVTVVSKRQPEGEDADDAILIYDRTHGSLRLTADLYDRLTAYADDIHRAAETGQLDVNPMLTEQFRQWTHELAAH